MAAVLFSKLRNLNMTAITKFMGPTWGPPGSYRPQMGPKLAPGTLLSGLLRLFPWISTRNTTMPCDPWCAPFYNTACRRSVCASANTVVVLLLVIMEDGMILSTMTSRAFWWMKITNEYHHIGYYESYINPHRLWEWREQIENRS